MDNKKIGKYEAKLKEVESDFYNSSTDLPYNEYEEELFSKMSNYLVNTDTIKKYSGILIEDTAYETINSVDNPIDVIFSLDTDLIDKIMLVLVEKLSKSYEVNEVYQDELKDLAQFEKEEISRVQKRMNMKKDLFELKKKYGPNLNILYDDFQGETEEIKSEVRNFKNKYMDEIEAELDIKFKDIFKLLADKTPKTQSKTDNPAEFEKDQKFIEKFEEIYKKIMDEIRSKQKGTYKQPETIEEEKNPEDDIVRLEYGIRNILQNKFLGVISVKDELMPKYIDDDVPDQNEYLPIPKRVFKEHKVPEEEEKTDINRRMKRFYDLINYSKTESTIIPKERVELIKDKFLEYFGRYNDIIYPDGFRHLESFEMYQSVYPLRDMSEYVSECIFHINFSDLDFFSLNKYKNNFKFIKFIF